MKYFFCLNSSNFCESLSWNFSFSRIHFIFSNYNRKILIQYFTSFENFRLDLNSIQHNNKNAKSMHIKSRVEGLKRLDIFTFPNFQFWYTRPSNQRTRKKSTTNVISLFLPPILSHWTLSCQKISNAHLNIRNSIQGKIINYEIYSAPE